jgi:RHS repeat-associated protein
MFSKTSRSHQEEGSRGEVRHVLSLLRSFHARSPMSNWKIFLVTSFLCIYLLTNAIGNIPIAAAAVRPPTHLPIAKTSFTMKQFLNQASSYKPVTGVHVASAGSSAIQNNGLSARAAATTVLPSSAEPPTMKAASAGIQVSTPTSSTPALHLSGSDPNGVRMEVTIPAGALDFSGATTASRVAVQGNLTVTLTQTRGHFITATRDLATYEIQVKDAKGQVVQGVKVRTPMIYTFHYQKSELANLLIDPNHLFLTFPSATTTSTQTTVVPLTNHAASNTLTASVTTLATATVGGGTEPIQAPPKPRFASVQGNGGQISYNYPFTVAPGPQGVTPQLQLSYSSGTTNARHDPTTPAGNTGDGWTLALGSISAEQYPDGTIWYSINGIDGVSDLLIPNKNGNGDYATEHMSYLKISRITNPVVSGRYCFDVWDGSGNKNELGCTKDALQSYHDSDNDQFDYSYDLDKVTASNEGSGTNNRTMTIKYLQDVESESGHTSVRDAAPQQIVYRTTTNGNTTPAGTVDFFYDGPSNSTTNGTQFETQYTSAYESACNLPEASAQQRCDDPLDRNGLSDPSVMSTLELTRVKSYVGDDSSTSHLDYSYALTYRDTPFLNCPSSTSNLSNYWCAGEHVLTAITPTVYQNGNSHQLAGMTFAYSDHTNKYDDFTQNPHYHMENTWAYLISYHDHSNGVGASSIVYQTAWNNSHGTPYNGGDNRYDALYCDWNPNDCTSGASNPADDQMWTEQVVFSLTSVGKDSSSGNLSPSTINYNYWLTQTQGSCPADSQGTNACVGFGWMPNSGDTSSQGSYYHGEFRGFGTVLALAPSGSNTSQPYNLTVDKYASTYGWGSSVTDSRNYLAGSLLEEDVYQGPYTNGANLLQQTVNSYAGQNGTPNTCSTVYTTTHTPTYTPCEVVLLSTKTTQYEQTGTSNTNAPWVQKTYTYDDYSTSSGLDQSNPPKYYHNTLTEALSGSNVPTSTKKATYATTNTTSNGITYYNVHSVAHSEVDDSNGNATQCSYAKYDEGAASGVPTPAQGSPTTVTSYSNGCNTSSAITTYMGYDTDGNAVATVDGVAAASPGLYNSGSAGCNNVTPKFLTSTWAAGRFTSCIAYSATNAQKTDAWNVYGQHTKTTYDATQGLLPTAITDSNNLTTSTIDSYDSSGNPIVQVKNSDEAGVYTKQGTLKSTCTDSSMYPCLELDNNSLLYSGAVAQVFYDSTGRKVETLTPGPDATHTTVNFTVYNDINHSVFTSQPLVISTRTTWLDPNDPSVASLGGTATYVDAAGRTIATMDAIFASGGNSGTACPSLTAYTAQWSTPLTRATTCTSYGLGTVSGDSKTYEVTTTIDANQHVQGSYTDVLNNEKDASPDGKDTPANEKTPRIRYVLTYSGTYGGTLTAATQTAAQYNVFNKPTSMIVTDLTPQAGQTVSSVTTGVQYDGLGRVTSLSDPDRGNHAYTYDADGKALTDVSGTRTLGTSYDLLERARCVQDAAPITDGSGNCASGSHPLVQTTYDTTTLGTQGTNDFPVGQVTKSIATTYYPDGTSATTTEQFQHDQRGQATTSTQQIALPGDWNVTTALPTYQETQAYNDANQPTTTQTTISGQPGYTFSQAYDSTTGQLTGLSNNSTGVANLATLAFNSQALVSDINFQTTTGSALADLNLSYDGDLRVAGANATWQSGSGSTGIIFSQGVAYDAMGNVVSKLITHSAVNGQSTSGGTATENFCYDEQNRLVWAGNSGTQPAAGSGICGSSTLGNTLGGNSYNASYAYTNVGQIWQEPLGGVGVEQQALYCDNAHPHQLTGLYTMGTTCANLANASYSTGYDAWGNLTSRTYNGSTATLSYDVLDHLTQWNAGTNSQDWYVYDASGQRVLQRSTTSNTVYAFGLEEHVYDGSGNHQSDTYYYTLNKRLIGALTGGNIQFYLTDTLGSVLSTFNDVAGSAIILGNQVYTPYGTKGYTAGSMGTNKGYTGQYEDPTGLDYYNARYYDPVIGLFITADTKQDNSHGFDPYAYVAGNPETQNDPTGHQSNGVCDLACHAAKAAAALHAYDAKATARISIGSDIFNLAMDAISIASDWGNAFAMIVDIAGSVLPHFLHLIADMVTLFGGTVSPLIQSFLAVGDAIAATANLIKSLTFFLFIGTGVVKTLASFVGKSVKDVVMSATTSLFSSGGSFVSMSQDVINLQDYNIDHVWQPQRIIDQCQATPGLSC